MIKRLAIIFVVLVTLGGAAAYFLLPWNDIIEKRVAAFLQDNGFDNVTFDIDRIGLHSLTLSNVAVGVENPLRLQSISVEYDLREILDGRIDTLELSGLDFQLTETQNGWRMDGFSVPAADEKNEEKSSLSRVLTILDDLPVRSVSIADSTLRIDGQAFDTSLPFHLTLAKGEKSILDLTVMATSMELNKSGLATGEWRVTAEQQQDRTWQGNWAINAIDASGLFPMPIVDAQGTIKIDEDAILLNGAASDKGKSHAAVFSGLFSPQSSENSKLSIQSGSFPFLNGKISTKNIELPLKRTKNITVNLTAQKISIDVMLQKMTGERVTATGTVSGTLPVIIRPDNSFILGKGSLKADAEGIIKMAAEAIPGDNQQIELVRQVMENLHYKVFSASVDPSANGDMTVRLALEGSNPEVYDGRLVKLNVNLTGDVLDFITQNAILFGSPEKLLEQ